MHKKIYLLVGFFLFLGSKIYSQTSVSLFQDNLETPNPMITDGNDLYVGYYYSDKVVKFDLNNPNTPPVDVVTGVNRPYGLAIRENKLYISEFGGDKLSRINLNETNPNVETILWNINSPIGLEFIGDELYIALEGDNKVVKIDVSQVSPQATHVVNVSKPFEIEIVNQQMYITERFTGNVVKYDLGNNSSSTEIIAQGLNYPSGLTFNGQDLFVAEAGASKISKINIMAANSTITGNITSNLLQYPSGLLMHNNNLYITDFFANSLFKVNLENLSISEINNSSLKEIKIFPNPSVDKLNISNTTSKEFKIFDMNGRVVKSGTIQNSSIYISELIPGNYILKVGSSIKKFIKK